MGLSLLFAAQSDALVLILSLGFSYFAKFFFQLKHEVDAWCILLPRAHSLHFTPMYFMIESLVILVTSNVCHYSCWVSMKSNFTARQKGVYLHFSILINLKICLQITSPSVQGLQLSMVTIPLMGRMDAKPSLPIKICQHTLKVKMVWRGK